MKRTASAMTLLAALGGGCMTSQTAPTQPAALQSTSRFNQVGQAREAPGLIGPYGAPVPIKGDGTIVQPGDSVQPVTVRGQSPDDKVVPAVATGSAGSDLQLTSANSRAAKALGGEAVRAGKGRVGTGQVPPPPPAGPPGAVAAIPGPALPGGLPAMGTARSSIRFVGQDGMSIGWFAPTGPGQLGFRDQLVTPGRYNFLQGGIYRLRLSNIPRRPGLFLYPTVEVVPQSPKTSSFLAHSAIPLAFTDEDIQQAIDGNFVVKVIYLPDPQYQDLAIAGPDEIVSTRLEPGIDPIQEAQRRGSVLLIVRLGNIDLETQGTPAMDAPNPYLRPPGIGLPGGYPPIAPPPAGAIPSAPGGGLISPMAPNGLSSDMPLPRPIGSTNLP